MGPTSLPPFPSPHQAACSALHQTLEAELRRHQVKCADLLQRGRDLRARGLPMQWDPRERAEAVQGLWQWLRGLAAGWGARLQAALLIQQVERQPAVGGQVGCAGSVALSCLLPAVLH